MNSLYEKIHIIHFPSESEPFVVLDKPRGLPSAPLAQGDRCVVTFALEKFPEIKSVAGKKPIEYGLVHRIDTETRGLLLIATSQEFYDRINQEQINGRFIKGYEADCDLLACNEGFPASGGFYENVLNGIKKMTNESSLNVELCSKFRPYGLKNKEVRPVTEFSGKAAEKKASPKEYRTKIKLTKSDGGIHASCSLTEGYRHQVRCHLAWIGLPIKGDPLYNDVKDPDGEFKFTATSLEFLGFRFSL